MDVATAAAAAVHFALNFDFLANKIAMSHWQTLFYCCESRRLFCTLRKCCCAAVTARLLLCRVLSVMIIGWLSQYDNVGTLATLGRSDCGFCLLKLVIKCSNETTIMYKSYSVDSEIFFLNKSNRPHVLFSSSNFVWMQWHFVSFLTIKSKWNEFVGFIACKQPASQFQGNKLLKPSAKCTW